ncbi:uncharacterized protein LOC114356678 isoform X2 [Ostrinia furnacalis]|uniref:uncharacterized protein LOC114356678 isoform X2 n=1 Tax=Ostrinia furnacalis TaxID=93504 RepID=UPI0010396250|nr:uncharacterized protein LOC114356678 isoform X2 [Ostrinia furnacalis]
MELENMHNLPLRQRGRPRGHNRARLSKEQQKERNKYYEQLRRKEIKERWTELVQLINPEKVHQPKSDKEVAIYIADLEDDASDAEKEAEQLRADNAKLRKKLRRLQASLRRQESPPRKRAAPAGGRECAPQSFVDQLLHVEESEAMDVDLSAFEVVAEESIPFSGAMDVLPSEIILGVLPSKEKMEECNEVSLNNPITDAVVVPAEQHDSGVDSPPGNLLDLLPVYPEEDALLETIAAMDIPDPLDIDVNPSGFLLPPPATHQLPDVTSKSIVFLEQCDHQQVKFITGLSNARRLSTGEGLAEVDRLVALFFNS